MKPRALLPDENEWENGESDRAGRVSHFYPPYGWAPALPLSHSLSFDAEAPVNKQG
jgi:hypothetical protein